jgi:ATP-binding cassette subfamily F protein 3
LIKTVADTLWLVADGKLKVFEGDLDDYQHWLRDRAKTEQAVGLKPRSAKKAPRDPLASLRRELDQVERRIAAIAAEQTSLDAQAGGPGLPPKLADKRARLTRDAASLEARWMEIGAALEASEAQGLNGG